MRAPNAHREPSRKAPKVDLDLSFRLYLRKEFLSRCRQSPGTYSMRTFARALKIDYTTLSKILSGRRKIGKRVMKSLGERLGLNEAEIQRFQTVGEGRERADAFRTLTLDTFQVVADWHHFAILELTRLERFQPDPRWISKTLGLSLKETTEALERLTRLGLLGIAPDGAWYDASGGKTTNIGPDLGSSANRMLQRQILTLAQRALDETPLERRSQSAMIMAIDRSRLDEARTRITEFRRGLARFLSREGAHPDEVYHLSVSLYPVTQSEKENES